MAEIQIEEEKEYFPEIELSDMERSNVFKEYKINPITRDVDYETADTDTTEESDLEPLEPDEEFDED